ncbi:MAG: Bax inhibitor-1/YccA family protein [Flavobacteriales bacterium]|nr:Bax inhibitor-1/YccA family protein [Flavobacteriales bacterium]
METKKLFKSPIETTSSSSGAITQTFLSNVFSYMASALAITGIIAYWFGTDSELSSILYNVVDGINRPNIFGYIVMLLPLGFVLLMSFGFQKLSSMAMVILFIIYSAIMGISLSTIFLVYSLGSIFMTFFITAGTFGIMAFVGYTTKTDLTKFGSILMMGLIGIIIASVVNMFMGSETMDYIISILGVLIFTGLTAYDVQKLKRIGSGVEFGTEETNKLAVMGALTLYLDFINLFLFLLRFLGDRK